MTAGQSSEPARTRWPLRGFLVFTFILVVAPPVGALLLAAPLTFIASEKGVADFTGDAWLHEIQSYLAVTWIMMMLSHLFGGVQAFLSGLWLGVRTAYRGTFGYIEALITGLVTSLIWGLRFGDVRGVFYRVSDALTGTEPVPDASSPATVLIVLVGAGLLSALACRWLLRVVRILPA